MSAIVTPTCPPAPSGSRLRLVGDTEVPYAASSQSEECLAAEHTPVDDDIRHVLVAGADASARSRMLAELRNLLPASTHFVEAHETWEVLARAASSRMVVLTDDLSDGSSELLVRLLGRKNPTLPVLAVGNPAHASASTDSNAASV